MFLVVNSEVTSQATHQIWDHFFTLVVLPGATLSDLSWFGTSSVSGMTARDCECTRAGYICLFHSSSDTCDFCFFFKYVVNQSNFYIRSCKTSYELWH